MYMSQVEKFARTKLPKIFINNHVKKVVQEALWLCKFYPEADKEVVKTGAWLHDVTHLVGGYKGKDEHNIASSKTAKEFLTSINFDKNKLKKVIHCIKAHRTSTPPEPRTKEAKIVASADNLAHFVMADFLVKRMGLKRVVKKLRRDLRSKFMLPEASEKAR
ncbi:HD domain-containing protein, partial [Candidatus Woesearchaeota archaeon]|nr:HD domain-containing protein [Candidatus Woesearchaeota archaeon]